MPCEGVATMVEEPNFTLTFLTEDAKTKRIAEDYWAGRREGYRWKWTETAGWGQS